MKRLKRGKLSNVFPSRLIYVLGRLEGQLPEPEYIYLQYYPLLQTDLFLIKSLGDK
jgi:hypothetical protein